MGKTLIQQRRGKGKNRFRAPSFRYLGAPQHRPLQPEVQVTGTVTDIVHCQGHTSPLMDVLYEDKVQSLMIAPEGIRVGDTVREAPDAEIKPGNTLPLKAIPEGTNIYNIESQPGDGGKFVRCSGVCARLLSKLRDKIVVELPSKKTREFSPECRAIIGVIAGAGRKEKPFYKAGRRHFARKARNKFYPLVTAQAMNAVDHPFGSKGSTKKGRPTIAPKNAPPGRNVGMLHPRRTGRTKR